MCKNLSEAPKADGRGETSSRRPYCLLKMCEKRPLGENLCEALKADGKGEKIMEAPLLSFEKKQKTRNKQRNRENRFKI